MMVVFNSRIKFRHNEGFAATDHLAKPPRSGGFELSSGATSTGVVVTREEYRLPLDDWGYQVSQFITGM